MCHEQRRCLAGWLCCKAETNHVPIAQVSLSFLFGGVPIMNRYS